MVYNSYNLGLHPRVGWLLIFFFDFFFVDLLWFTWDDPVNEEIPNST